MTIYYTADNHHGHANIIKYCSRPYTSIDEMDSALIRNWNERVTANDTVYVLGDFAWYKSGVLYSIFYALNGQKHLIIGNHDGKTTLALPWQSVAQYAEISDHNTRVVLFHYPIVSWNHKSHGAVHLYGHVHNAMIPTAQSCDVGVDCWNYAPVTLAEAKERMDKHKKYTLADSNL